MSGSIDFTSPAYVRTRRAYLWECAFEYFISLLVADAFLTRLLHSIGFDDAACGLIASFISLAFLFQLVSVFVVRRITNTKRTAILVHAAAQLLFTSLYIVPFLPVAPSARKVIAVLFLLGAYFCNYFVTNLIYRWANSFVDPAHRARYSATKEMISLISGIPVSLGLGAVMDYFYDIGNLQGGFLFAAVSMLVFVICDVICLMTFANEKRETVQTRETVPLRTILQNTLGNRSFRRVVVLLCIFEASRYSLIGFLGTFKQYDLAYSVTAITVINTVGSLGRAALTPAFGKFADRHSYIRTIEVATLVMMVGFAAVLFTNSATRWLIIIHVLLYQISLAGTSQNFYNITYSYVDSRYYAEASAIKNSIGGLCGFVAALLSARLLAFIQANGNRLFGIPVLGQQVLAGISLLLAALALIYAHFVVGKQKITGK